jgi:hypothetical protein
LVFTAAAAVTGYLGVLIGWLSYRLEAGRVPKPDLAIVSEGDLVRHWYIEIELLDPEPEVSSETQNERERMEGVIERLKPSADTAATRGAALMGPWVKHVSEGAIAEYRKEVEEYLGEYQAYLKDRHLAETFWARSRRLVFAFTNERAGVPAEGVRAIIRLQTDDDLHLFEESDIPEFSVKEVLHNLYEDTRDHPLVLLFNRAGTWIVPYEVHARNLPKPKSGTLTLTVRVGEAEANSPG